jgi:hypothetical protein
LASHQRNNVEFAMINLINKSWLSLSKIITLSFKEAVLEPFPGYYKMKPNNAYWDGRNKRALWYRIIVLLATVVIVFSFVSISHKQYPWKLAAEKYALARQGWPMMTKDFPMRLIAYPRMWWNVNFNGPKKDDIDAALNDSRTKTLIFGLLRTRLSFSEIGGAAFLKNGLLVFYPIDNPNRLIALEIKKALDDDARLAEKYQKYKDVIQKKFGDDPAISKLGAAIRKTNDKAKMKRILMHFVFLSNFDYEVNFDKLLELFYFKDSKGQYAGQFHVHKMGEKPSLVDLESSKINNIFVLSEVSGDKTTFYWLKGGKVFFAKDISKNR